jgi:glycosyltransferase involved in cell wall biosynthesis
MGQQHRAGPLPAGHEAAGQRRLPAAVTWPGATARPDGMPELPSQPVPPRVKVLHVITKFWAGAGGNTLLTVLGSDPVRYETWVAGCEGGPLWARAERAGVTTVRLKRFREVISPLNDLSVLIQLIRLIRRERFAIVHTHSAKAGFLGRLAAWLCRTPVVVHTFHGLPFHRYMSAGRRGAYVLLDRLVRPMTDAFIAVAPRVAQEAIERRIAPPGGVTVVPSAVELDQIPSRPDPSVRVDLGIPQDVPLVGTVGRLEAQKAPLDFVRMAAQVAAVRPDVCFVMVGDGPLADDAEAEARRLGVEIRFAGFRPDAPRIAAAFDVFVISSRYEGLGRALTEAVAAGRPVAATAVNGVPDLIVPGSTGLLAPPGDFGALASCVLWLLDHPAEAAHMGETASRHVRWMFHPALMCALIDQTYCRLLGLPGPDAEPPPPPPQQDPPASVAPNAGRPAAHARPVPRAHDRPGNGTPRPSAIGKEETQ